MLTSVAESMKAAVTSAVAMVGLMFLGCLLAAPVMLVLMARAELQGVTAMIAASGR